MSIIGVVPVATECGDGLSGILLGGDIVPGDAPSYQLAKNIFIFHPLGAKIVEGPVRMAMSQDRLVTIEDAPGEEVKEEFLAVRKRLSVDNYIRDTMFITRIYGVGSLVCGTIGQPPSEPLDLTKIGSKQIYFSVMDALNTAGSLVLNQDPNSHLFQKAGDITVAGTPYHRSRAQVLFRGTPIYLAYSNSAYGFSGRSVYQAALYPLRSFIRTMITDDLVAQKAGLIVAFMKATGSVINAIQQGAAAIKRILLKQGATGEVLSVGHEDRIESVNLENVDKAMITSRSNIIKNIATAVPMPARLLEQEAFAEGFGEGTEDTKDIVRYCCEIRMEMEPLFAFTDPICQRMAWTPEFITAMREKYPGRYDGQSDDAVFYSWKNRFKATWPSLLEEPESEKAKQDKAKLDGILGLYQALSPKANEDGQMALVEFMAANVNSWRNLFEVPLSIDPADFCEQPDMDMLEAQSNLAPKPAGKPSLSVAK